MLEWIRDHPVLLSSAAFASILIGVLSVLLVPAVLVRIPADYFAREERPESPFRERSAAIRLAALILKNVIGWCLILAGVAMLALPGQGLLTLLVGFLLIDFPRKYALEKWIVSRQRVLRAVNWLRLRRGRAPLLIPEAPGSRR